jgi:hypothetical protein
MIDMRQSNAHTPPESNESKIPAQASEELRRLSHDLSNALEVVLQTNYLLGMTEGSLDESRKWREMLDKGVAQASHINRQLRDYVRSHS